LEEIRQGKIKIGGDQTLLDEIVTTYEIKKGNGGKQYFELDTVNYFPKAQYGLFVAKRK
jgi:hypothetical protein